MNISQKRKSRPGDAGSQQSPKLSRKQRRQLQRQEELQQKQLAENRLAERRRLIKRVVRWSGLLLGLILMVLGLIYFTDKPEPEAAPRLPHPVPAAGRAIGNPDAPITLVEYSDYQCPRCAYYHPIITQLVQTLGDDFRFIFRHYPLRNHANAKLAARSAEAAGRQGKFWEMHDLLFAEQEKWAKKEQAEASRFFLKYAASLNLDVNQFQKDLLSQEVINKVDNDHQEGRRSGVTSTPIFFLNGQKVLNKPRTYEEFQALILQTKTEPH